MDNPNKAEDLEVLAASLHQLLTGELKVGLGMVKVGKSLSREGRSTEWIKKGLNRWVNENEDALPILAAALGTSGIEKLKAWSE